MATNPLDTPRRSRVINMRATAEQDLCIRLAAANASKSVTEFILDSAYAAAIDRLLDRRLFIADAQAWKRFTSILDRPVTGKRRLTRLMREKSVLER